MAGMKTAALVAAVAIFGTILAQHFVVLIPSPLPSTIEIGTEKYRNVFRMTEQCMQEPVKCVLLALQLVFLRYAIVSVV